VRTKEISLRINGESYQWAVESNLTLLDFLREKLDLIGTKKGCETGECGACTVLLNGKTVNSCLVLAVEADGREVTTIEGLLGDDGRLHPLQEAFVEAGAIQCGFCTPGMIMSSKELLDRNPRPSEEEIKDEMAGNLCRCTGYVKIIEAITKASKKLTTEE
jgi:carbon-monoxide dehydrogenase small subunit